MNWIVLILAALALVFASIMKESYAPTLLRKKAARLRKENDDPRYWSRYDEKQSLLEVMKVNLSRPFVMAFTEPIWYEPSLAVLNSADLHIAAYFGISTSPSYMAFYICAS